MGDRFVDVAAWFSSLAYAAGMKRLGRRHLELVATCLSNGGGTLVFAGRLPGTRGRR